MRLAASWMVLRKRLVDPPLGNKVVFDSVNAGADAEEHKRRGSRI
jgi:hypothetical protein